MVFKSLSSGFWIGTTGPRCSPDTSKSIRAGGWRVIAGCQARVHKSTFKFSAALNSTPAWGDENFVTWEIWDTEFSHSFLFNFENHKNVWRKVLMGEATMGQQWSNCRRSGSAGLARCQCKQLYYSMGGCFVLIWRRGVIDDTSLHHNTTLCFIMKHHNGWIVISYTSAREESVMCIVHSNYIQFCWDFYHQVCQ